MYILSVDIQENHVKLKKLLLFKPNQKVYKSFRWKEIWGHLIQLFILKLESEAQGVYFSQVFHSHN